ncbi:phage protein [Stenotrophomonas maltophilia]|uniref:phage protein n=1 Tax=Stenotrophomonas maltophilia TaxID=40324 RepID=UPI003D189A24
MPRFRRTYRLVVGPPGGQGTTILPPMQIQFDVQKDAEEDPNVHSIRIYNLAPSTRKALEKPDLRAYLYAGYEEESGAILLAAGTVVDAFTRFDSPDVVTELAIADGYGELRDSAVSLSYGEGATSATIIQDVAGKMGLVLNMPRSLTARAWEHGFSFYGPARAALHKLCRGAGLEWSIQNQTLQVVATKGVTERSVVVLNAASGLIGSPERVREASREKDAGGGRTVRSERQRRDGWRVRSLLLPWLNPGDRVRMDSRQVKGIWRVESVSHSGDYHGGDWTTDLHIVEML